MNQMSAPRITQQPSSIGIIANLANKEGSRVRRLGVLGFLALLFGVILPIQATETNGATAWTGVQGGNSATVNEPSGLTATVTTTSVATRGLITVGNTTTPTLVSQPLNSRAATAAMFGTQDSADADALLDSPAALAVGTTQAVNFVAQVLASCPIAPASSTAICTNMGTITVTFSRPVRNPVLHLSGIGGTNDSGGLFGSDVARLNARLTLASSLPAGASLGVRSAGAVNMVASGNTIETANVDASVSCGTLDDAAPTNAAALAGCGSVQVNGTVTSLTFNVEMKYRVVDCTGFLCTPSSINITGSADAFNLTVSLPQDFSDAPASFGVPRHVIGDLRIGGANDADRTNAENPTTSTFAATSPNDAIGDDTEASAADDNEPGDDEEGVTFNGGLTTAMIGSAYTATVALSGASQAGETCGWIDFNRNGTFETTERACATFVAGAAAANLSWTIPTATTAGRAYARVRAAYGAAGAAQNFDGALASGEVEDYQLDIKPVVRIAKVLIDPSPTPGTFNLQINGATYAAAIGNGGSTGYKTVYTTSRSGLGAANANTVNDINSATNIESTGVTVTSAETAAGTTQLSGYSTTVACVNAAGTAVTFTAGTANQSISSLTIPQSVTGASANGQAQTITCTYTNTRLGSITIVKDAVPNDAQDFAFTTTGTGLSAFSLDDDADATLSNTRTFNNLAAGAYSVTETTLTGWTLSNLACVDPDNGSTVNVGTGVANIDVDLGENVTCTYTNTRNTADLVITKTNTPGANGNVDQSGDTVTRGTTTTYTIVVTNNGPDAITGAVVRDPARAGLICTDPVPCTGSGCPSATVPLSSLQSTSGVVLGTMVNGGTVTFTLSCTVQ